MTAQQMIDSTQWPRSVKVAYIVLALVCIVMTVRINQQASDAQAPTDYDRPAYRPDANIR
jgi:hypothetical protein